MTGLRTSPADLDLSIVKDLLCSLQADVAKLSLGMGPEEFWTPHGIEQHRKLPKWQPLYYNFKTERLEQASPLELQPE